MRLNQDEKTGIAMIFLGILMGIFFMLKVFYWSEILAVYEFFIGLPWKRIGIGTILFFILYRVSKRVKKKFKQRRFEKQQIELKHEAQKENLQSLVKTKFKNLDAEQTRKKKNLLQHQIKDFPAHLQEEFKEEINRVNKRVDQLINKRSAVELYRANRERAAEEARKKKEQAQQNEFENQVTELLDFKKKHRKAKVLPIKKVFSEKVRNEAYCRMLNLLEEKEEKKELREEAIHYYQEHALNTKPVLDEEKEVVYEQVREDIENGKLNIKKKKVFEYAGEKLPENFYRAKELDDIEKKQAIAQGFTHVRGNELDGKICGGGFYIRKENDRESAWHFVMKHLFAKLHENMYVEYAIKDKRLDVALLFENYLLGIEIESGVNKPEQIIDKVEWMNKHCADWIIVCRKKDITKYVKYVNNKRSFCLTPKKAKELVLEIIPPEEHLSDNGENV